MKILLEINLAVLIFLALSSGITKIILMPQEVEFFGSIITPVTVSIRLKVTQDDLV